MPIWAASCLVVEDAGHAVVETHGVKRAGTSDPVCIQPVLVELWHRPIIPAERRRVVVQIFQEAVLCERDHCRQPDQVGRVVTREKHRRRGDEIRELFHADVPGDIRELSS